MKPGIFLTAEWRHLIVLNYPIEPELLEPYLPPGLDLDYWNGTTYVSLVAFFFERTRLCGLSIPFHRNFPEVDLRFYVKRPTPHGERRGVVFVREIVPRRAVALIANWLYHEHYIARRMRSEIHMAGSELSAGDTIEYAWATRWRISPPVSGVGLGEGQRWNRLAARVAAPLQLPPPGSLEEFLVEHYWGYVRAPGGTTREYRVAHDPWQVAPADNVTWDCDLAATYHTPLAEYLAVPPAHAIIAAGSPVKLYPGRRL